MSPFMKLDAQNVECCNAVKRKAQDGTVSKTVIYFDKFGSPEKPTLFVPFGTQVDLRVKNYNPLNAPPVATLSFNNFNTTSSGNIPNIADLFPVVNTNEILPSAKENVELTNNEELVNKKLAYIRPYNYSLMFSIKEKDSIGLLIKDKQSELDSAKNNEEKEELKRKINELQGKLRNEETKIKYLNAKVDSLDKVIADLINKKKLSETLLKSYKNLCITNSQFNQFITIEKQINSLFNQQYIDKSFVDKKIGEILRASLPNYDPNNVLKSANDFIRNSFDSVLINYSNMLDCYGQLNKLPIVDSFEGKSKFDLSKGAKIDISKIKVFINRDEIFKSQKEDADIKVKLYKNDSLKQAIILAMDTFLLKVMRLQNESFETTIKSFQADADEIKINLPFANSSPYIIKTYCRFKVEGSTGIFAHFGNLDDKYLVVKNGTENQIIKQKTEFVSFNLGFLAHFYTFDQRKNFNWGGLVGINLPVSNTANSTGNGIQLVTGICLNSTTIDKLSLNFGLSFKRGNKLNTNNLTSVNGVEVYKFNNTNDLTPQYDPITRVGFFFGLSYSLFNSKSKESK